MEKLKEIEMVVHKGKSIFKKYWKIVENPLLRSPEWGFTYKEKPTGKWRYRAFKFLDVPAKVPIYPNGQVPEDERKEIFVSHGCRLISDEEIDDDSFKHVRKKPVMVSTIKMKKEFIVKTLEGDMCGNAGDYLIKGVNGELYPCNEEIFKKTYEEFP
jgi:hypothetical protein